ncbi:multidrug and toxin extrusion protein 1 [Petromyzon marinus]|uniref:Multidrug and toxin extrusion protein n=1 Tax=Petromyzon marinus TaxID=7757 RepID=A0AAJ7SQG1_PETMA|nr:multidrug and toxin extrusion protein 1 [Petromyzon marinus]
MGHPCGNLCGGGRCRALSRFVPVNWKNELREVAMLAVPVTVSSFLIFCISMVSTVFCGHLGKIELDSVMLASAVINITAIAVGVGMSLACDTLMSQAFGAKNLHEVGVILQRGIIILMLSCCPCWALFLNIRPFLLTIGQDPEVARLASLYVLICIPALPAIFLYQLESKYLQNQSITMPQVYTGLLMNGLNALFNYIFIYVMDMGVPGSAVAYVISNYSQSILLFVYIRVRGLHRNTWAGWSWDCLQNWGVFMRLALPSLVMVCMEWWAYEVGIFLTGVLGVLEQASQAVTYQLITITYMIPLGLSVAVNVRVGNALGAGRPEQANNSAKVVMICIGFMELLNAVILVAGRHVVAYVFTTAHDVIDMVAAIMPVCAAYQLFEGIVVVSGGILRGGGRQKVGAVANFMGYNVFSLPIGISLMFCTSLRVIGLWIGMLVGLVMLCIFMIFYVCQLDWKAMANEAQERSGIGVKPQNVEEQQDVDKDMNGLSGLPAEHDSSEMSPEVIVLPLNGIDSNADMEGLEELNAPRHLLPAITLRQLLLRRSLAVLLSLAVLAAGITVRMMTQVEDSPARPTPFNSTVSSAVTEGSRLLPV